MLNNSCTFTGEVVRNHAVPFANGQGTTHLITLMVEGYSSKKGEYIKQYPQIKAFATGERGKIYTILEPGDLVQCECHVDNSPHADKTTGELVYPKENVMICDLMRFTTDKETNNAHKAGRAQRIAAKNAAAQAAAPQPVAQPVYQQAAPAGYPQPMYAQPQPVAQQPVYAPQAQPAPQPVAPQPAPAYPGAQPAL